MKYSKTQTTTSKGSTGEKLYEISSEELGRIHRKYHPQEHDLFDAVDEDYMKRFEKVFGTVAK